MNLMIGHIVKFQEMLFLPKDLKDLIVLIYDLLNNIENRQDRGRIT